MKMQDGLSEFLERQLRNRYGLSAADYQVLAHLSEAPEGRLRSFELGLVDMVTKCGVPSGSHVNQWRRR